MARITLHGSGAGVPNGDRFASAATLRFDDGSCILIDAGEACSRALVRDNVDSATIRSVVISHCHPDHWAGLPGLATAWLCGKRTAPVDVYVPEESLEFLRRVLIHSYLFSEVMPCEIRIRPLTTLALPDGMRLRPFPTSHLAGAHDLAARYGIPQSAFGFVISDQTGSIVFTQDVGSIDDLHGIIDGARLLIAECAHVDPSALLAAAREAYVERVIFTHVPPMARPFPPAGGIPPWVVAYDGMTVSV